MSPNESRMPAPPRPSVQQDSKADDTTSSRGGFPETWEERQALTFFFFQDCSARAAKEDGSVGGSAEMRLGPRWWVHYGASALAGSSPKQADAG